MTDEAIVEKDHLLIDALNLLAKILEGCGNALWEEAVVVNKLKSIFGEFCEIFLGIVFVRDLLQQKLFVLFFSLVVLWFCLQS